MSEVKVQSELASGETKEDIVLYWNFKPDFATFVDDKFASEIDVRWTFDDPII